MKYSLSLTMALALFAGAAHAQTLPTATENVAPVVTGFSSQDQEAIKEAKALQNTAQLWTSTLDWKETSATTADIVTHLKKSLGANAPAIEVRSKDTSRSTFALTKAPLGPTLTAVTDLANLGIWVFPGRLVLAPESSLTPEESTAIKEGKGGEWKACTEAGGTKWQPRVLLEKVAVTIIGAEVKASMAAQGKGPNVPEPPTTITENGQQITRRRTSDSPLPYEITFAELSPAAQGLIRDLTASRFPQGADPKVMESYKRYLESITPQPTSIVGFDDTRPEQFQLRISNPTPTPEDPKARRSIGSWSAMMTPPTP